MGWTQTFRPTPLRCVAQACSKSVEGKRCQFAPPPLTEREPKVIRALAQGMSDSQIAHAVGISEKTAQLHLEHLQEAAHLQQDPGRHLRHK
jgi:DNA-binding NarL/FixJ family response regulator